MNIITLANESRHRDLSVPPGDEIHYWAFTVGDYRARLGYYAALLDDAERARAARYLRQDDQHHFTLQRGLLREVLSAYTNISPPRIELSYGEHGKPYIANGPHFNLAHSHDVVVYAISGSRAVGIDIEHLHAVDDLTTVAGLCFTPSEHALFTRLTSESQQRDMFYRTWTAKEAVLKASGYGFHIPMTSVAVLTAARHGFELIQPVQVSPPDALPSRYELAVFDHAGVFRVAIALQI
jgi:4'-phosphopantetheinyl transferase